MPFADVNGQHLYYDDSGGDGPPVMFSHGFLMDHDMFAPQRAELSGAFRVIAWDERGFGRTPATGPFSYWDSAEDCLALLDHLEVGPTVLCGMSQGGFLSLRAALRAPDRVRGLVLIDTQAGLEDPASVDGYEAMGRTFIEQGPEPVQEVIAAIILGGGADHQVWFDKWAKLDRKGFEYAFRCLMDRDDISDQISSIQAPAIIFHGSDDAAIPMAKAAFLRDQLASCEGIEVVQGGGHASNLTHADQVNPKLSRFLRSLG